MKYNSCVSSKVNILYSRYHVFSKYMTEVASLINEFQYYNPYKSVICMQIIPNESMNIK